MRNPCNFRVAAHRVFPDRFAHVQVFARVAVGRFNVFNGDVFDIVRFAAVHTAGNGRGHFRVGGGNVFKRHAVDAADFLFVIFKAVAEPHQKRCADTVHCDVRDRYVLNVAAVARFNGNARIAVSHPVGKKEITVGNGNVGNVHLCFRADFKAVRVARNRAVFHGDVVDFIVTRF